MAKFGRRTTLADQHVSQRVREIRIKKGKTQEQVAAHLKLTFQQVQKYESGANRVSAGRLWQLSGLFNVPISSFYRGLRP